MNMDSLLCPIPGMRGGILYYEKEYPHYLYRKRATRHGVIQFSCHANYCKGSLIIKNDTWTVKSSVSHSHDGPDSHLFDAQLMENCKRLAIQTSKPLKQIFSEEATKFPKSTLNFKRVESTLHKTRKGAYPPLPNNVIEFGNSLQSSRHALTTDDRQFLKHWQSFNDEHNFIFVSPKFDEILPNTQEIYIDAKFNKIPTPFQSLYIIYILLKDTISPAIFVLMKNDSSQSQCLMLEYFRDSLRLLPSNIMTDFNDQLQSTCKEVYSKAYVSGCFFHYSYAMWQDVTLRDLQDLYINNESFRFAFGMLLAIATLPPECIADGLIAVEEFLRSKQLLDNEVKEFIKGYQLLWIEKITPKKLSMFGESSRTNLMLETIHYEIQVKLKRKYNVWQLLGNINAIVLYKD